MHQPASTRSILTIPSSDTAFAQYVSDLNARHRDSTASEFEHRLRAIFPRVVVRERSLSGEAPAWYVYRDGSWRPQSTGPWWLEENAPRVVASVDGWIIDASRTAADLLGIENLEADPRHFTDFVVPGVLDEATQLFDLVISGRELEATIVLRPTSGDLIAVEVRARLEGDKLVATFRLAEDVEVTTYPQPAGVDPSLTFVPVTDVAFRAYAQRAMDHMSDATAGGLELRLRRLYPHAHVDAEADKWIVHRDRADEAGDTASWWLDPDVARVRYDAQALILEANEAAASLFGRSMVGHFWQEFVTPGSTEQVGEMLEILAEVGAAESRFRMPLADGSLLEFDSYTKVDGDEFATAFRPVVTK